MQKTKILTIIFCFMIGSSLLASNQVQSDIAKNLVANQLYRRHQKFNVRNTYNRQVRSQGQTVAQAPAQIANQPQMAPQQDQSANNSQMPLSNTQPQITNPPLAGHQGQHQAQACPTCKQALNRALVNNNNIQQNSQPNTFNMKKLSAKRSVGFGARTRRRFK